MAHVFVTGGSGLVGAAIVKRLVAEGREVVALARSKDAQQHLADLGVSRVVRGDVLDRPALATGMAGCEVAYHVAGVNAFCLADPGPMLLANIEGSRRVVEAAATAGVGRLVYTSSAAALGEPKDTVGTELSTHRGAYLSDYERSKHLAEQAVRATAQRRRLEVVHVLPSSVQGPGRSGGTGRLLLDYVNGSLRAVVDSRLSIVDIEDCAQGHLLAEQHGRPDERYVLNGATMTVREGLELLGQVTGVSPTVRALPAPAAVAAAAAFEAVQRARGKHPRFCREMVRTLVHGHAYDGSKATAELGLTYTAAEHTLRRTVEWFIDQGLVTRPLPNIRGTEHLGRRR